MYVTNTFHRVSRILMRHNSRRSKFRKFCAGKTQFPENFLIDTDRDRIVLGIETSCDDTGVAIVNSKGQILGEALCSQQELHLKRGGIVPPVAQRMHAANITRVCEEALRKSGLKLRDVDAIATTVKPGLPMSLAVGLKFGKYLCRLGGKPFIPIHHMEAHTLMVRMVEKIPFPFLVLLISGGHCLLAFVKDIDEFYLLGKSIDTAPGEAFDKAARRLKLSNLPEFSKTNAGKAVEIAASRATNPDQFPIQLPMLQYRDCNFSFSGIKSTCSKHISIQEQEFDVMGDTLIPDYANLCAAFQIAICRHLSHKTQLAMEFLELNNLLPADKKVLVVSGGVACNNFVAKVLKVVCQEKGFEFARPPPDLCTDNGVMVAWNGMEKLLANKGIIHDPEEIEKVEVEHVSPLGVDWIEKVQEANIRCKWVKVTQAIRN